MNSRVTVGDLRQQTALCEHVRRVVVVAVGDPELTRILEGLEVVGAYPDTTDEYGKWKGCFKIQVSRRPA